MREIKFKGKRKDNGEWIVGNLFIPNKLVGGIWICPETTYGDFYPGLMEGDDLKDYEFGGISLGHFHEVIPETVGEYTGLKDKNGKEIYEGDLVQDFRKTFKYKCVFRENGAFEFQNITTLNYAMLYEIWDAEIIGNVFENPELLQK